MDYIKEAKKSNKEAYLALIDKYNIVFYKVCRIYTAYDMEIYSILEKALSNTYKQIVNIKNEKAFLLLTLKEIIIAGEELRKRNSKNNLSQEEIDEALQKNAKYRMYKSDSIVESCITLLNEKDRIFALLFYYVGLDAKEISTITGTSASEIEKRIDISRTEIYNYLANKGVTE